LSEIKIAAPLYIVRKECETDLFAVLERISQLGFEGVEFLGFFGKAPAEIKDKMKELNLVPVGNHVDYYEFLQDSASVIKLHKEIGCKYITIGGLPEDMIKDREELSVYLDNVIRIGRECREQGITLLYHNHDKELKYNLDGISLLQYMMDRLPMESISLEPDLGWIMIGGGEPKLFLERYMNRCPIVHLKDFYAEDITKIGNVSELNSQKGDEAHSYFEFRPVGYGIGNLPALMKRILNCNPEWIVADHDLAYERDSFFDLKVSFDYIKNMLAIVS
jgi:sugar phosphate isomerase/epimerase